ncbi:hypothetical protein [Nocardia sp. NPDC048505]|uniref:hypothetical protein n=1 Tax=unclassified Nocardia TaxID=2637762 RepID=UPI0033C88541
MQYLNDSTVGSFLAESGLRMLVFGTAADLSSQVFRSQITEFDQITGDQLAVGVIDVALAPATAAGWGVSATLPIQIVFADGVMHRLLYTDILNRSIGE